MKKITFILTSMLFLLVGGVFSQEVTTLYLNGGANWNATDGTNSWGSYSGSSVTYTAGDVTMNECCSKFVLRTTFSYATNLLF